MSQLRLPSVVLCDIEGTVLTSAGEAIPGAAEALAALTRAGIHVRLLSNVTRRSPAALTEQLRRHGIHVPDTHVVTAPLACRRFLLEQAGATCLLLVPPATREIFAGIEQTDLFDQGRVPDFVVIGDLAEDVSFATLNHAFTMVRAGAQLLAFNRNPWWMVDGQPRLDAGGFVALLEYATGTQARVMGKPAPDFFRMALGTISVDRDAILIVGDDPTTDLEGARAMGCQAVLVRTGKYDAGRDGPVDAVICDTLADLPRALGLGGGQ